MSDNDELLSKINYYKKQASEYADKLSDAKSRKVLIDDQLAKLGDRLQEVAGTVDWDELGNLITEAAEAAQEAVQALQEALDEAEVEYE